MATLSSDDLPDQELPAQVVPQPNRDAVAKWLFEVRFPNHAGYWDAGHTPEFTKNQFRKKADELTALSPAPLSIDRGTLAEVCQDAMRDAMNTFGPYSSSPQGKFIADAVIAHLTEHDRQVKAEATNVESLLEQSSLGTPEAQALRASVSDERAAEVLRMAGVIPAVNGEDEEDDDFDVPTAAQWDAEAHS